jgi:hypothetical protein
MATGSATWDYRDRFHDSFGRTYFRRYADGLVSSVGVGTYLGDPTDAVDDGYHEAIVQALESGCNVVDTAVNYRCQRSERVVGRAVADADVDRDAVLVATKGGFIPFDGSPPDDPGAYVKREFVDTGIVDRDALVRGSHCIVPEYLEHSLSTSLENLDLDQVDLFYVHNPETQLAAHDRETVYDRLEAAFTRLEERAAEGDLRHYGVATWECFRVPRDHPKHLSLAEIVSRAMPPTSARSRSRSTSRWPTRSPSRPSRGQTGTPACSGSPSRPASTCSRAPASARATSPTRFQSRSPRSSPGTPPPSAPSTSRAAPPA